jgi:hypothetical protein
MWSMGSYGAKTWTLRKVLGKYSESLEMWCCRRIELNWTVRVKNYKVLHRANEERNIQHTIKRRKAKWIGHILHRNCLLRHVIKGRLDGRDEKIGKKT